MKTVKFSQVVEKSGKPQLHLSWVPHAKDKLLMSALKANRVMSIHQTLRGSTKDYGTVGLLKTGETQLLIFPKSLSAFADRRVIAIDYGLFGEALSTSAPGPAAEPSRSRRNAPSSGSRLKKHSPDRASASSSISSASENVISFPHKKSARGQPASSAKAAPKPSSAPSKKSSPPKPALTLAEVLAEVELARRELRDKKEVAAYERLTSIVRGAHA